MASATYEHILREVEQLSADEQRQLLADIAAKLPQPTTPSTSIRELRGLGKEVWQGIDAQEYVNQERDAWDG